MEVWKMIFLSKWVICRFHVNLPGCRTSFLGIFFFCQLLGTGHFPKNIPTKPRRPPLGQKLSYSPVGGEVNMPKCHAKQLPNGCWTKNRGKTPKSFIENRVWNHYFHHPFWVFSPYFWKHPNLYSPELTTGTWKSPQLKSGKSSYHQTSMTLGSMLIFRGVDVVFYEIYDGFSNTMSQNWAGILDRNKNQDLLLEAIYINLRESGKKTDSSSFSSRSGCKGMSTPQNTWCHYTWTNPTTWWHQHEKPSSV